MPDDATCCMLPTEACAAHSSTMLPCKSMIFFCVLSILHLFLEVDSLSNGSHFQDTHLFGLYKEVMRYVCM